MRPGTVVTLLMVALAVGAVALVAVVKSIDMAAYRRALTEAFAAQTGHRVDIGGTLALKLSWSPKLVATDVRITDAAGGSPVDLVRISRVEAEIRLLPLLRREVEVRWLRLVNVDLQVDRGKFGRGKWRLDAIKPPPGGGNIPHTTLNLGRVSIDKGRLRIAEASGATTSITLERLVLDAEAGPLSLTLSGSIDQRPFDVSAVGGSVADITRQLRPFPLKLKASSGGLVATVDGTIGRPSAGEGLDLKLAVEGTEIAEAAKLLWGNLPGLGPFRAVARLGGTLAQPELADLDLAVGKKDVVRIIAKSKGAWPLGQPPLELAVVAEADDAAALARWFGLGAPQAQPLRASAQLAVTSGDLRFTELNATIGHSDIAGQMRLAARPARPPSLTATLVSKRVNAADLGLESSGAVSKGRSLPVMPDRPIGLAGLRGVELDITWKADLAEVRGLALNQATASIGLHDAQLLIDSFSARLGRGHVRGGLSVGGGDDEAVLVLDAQGVDLAALFDAAGLPTALAGHGAVELHLAGKRRSLYVITTPLDGSEDPARRVLAPRLPPEVSTPTDCLAVPDGGRALAVNIDRGGPGSAVDAQAIGFPMPDENACAATLRWVKQPPGRFLGTPLRLLPGGMSKELDSEP